MAVTRDEFTALTQQLNDFGSRIVTQDGELRNTLDSQANDLRQMIAGIQNDLLTLNDRINQNNILFAGATRESFDNLRRVTEWCGTTGTNDLSQTLQQMSGTITGIQAQFIAHQTNAANMDGRINLVEQHRSAVEGRLTDVERRYVTSQLNNNANAGNPQSFGKLIK